ncbi:MAG: saccharopine dehydrogenase NADP-binding domain-containing protein [Halobacteriales archaeon]|nr:saccharopine dehydrogenase NADP-binding domain-containing protein [Halobacteriales archaeon]
MLLVYGSYGYTGRLVVEECDRRGVDVVVAGRNAEKVEKQAERWGFEGRVFSLDADEAREGVEDADAVLNCAGPFSKTHGALVDACIAEGADYLDITGEVDVFDSVSRRDEEAREAGVTLVPGVGFDVVPSDCLAVYLAEKVDEPSYIALALRNLPNVSPGTARTVVESLGKSGVVRRDGELREVPPAWKTRHADFGDGRGNVEVTTMPLGDVVTAYHSTGAENIECYVDLPRPARLLARTSRYTAPLLRAKPTQSLLKRVADALAEGPDEKERVEEHGYIWGEVRGKDANSDDEVHVARLRTPEPYALTAKTASTALERVGDAETGFQTPATAFGAEFIVEFDGVEREDVEP